MLIHDVVITHFLYFKVFTEIKNICSSVSDLVVWLTKESERRNVKSI